MPCHRSRLLLGLAPPLVYVLAIATGFCVYEAALTVGPLRRCS